MEPIGDSYTSYLRKASRQGSGLENQPRRVVCSICKTPIPNATESAFSRHVKAEHADVLATSKSEEEKTGVIQRLWAATRSAGEGEGSGPKSGVADVEGAGESTQPPQPSPSNRSRGPTASPAKANVTPQSGQTLGVPDAPTSPGSSLKREGGSRSQSPPKRTKALPAEDDTKFEPRPRQSGTLWTPDGAEPSSRIGRLDRSAGANPQKPRPSSSQPRFPGHGRPSQGGGSQRPHHSLPSEDQTSVMIKQPETRPISSEQLVVEVKGIYAGLVMVESKCIEVDNAQNAQNDSATKLNNEQWQALIALHRTLLHEHHDFFLASQHPSASLALRKLASKYAMPARMWRHGIHSFLELLRHRLPDSMEHMLTFIYLAYAMMALLYETVPAFEDTWIECLGDLGRYRMAIEDDIHDREIWTAVSRQWYSKASDKAPTTGRLYHHMAILARPNALQQLFFYVKSLCVEVPFESARESIMTLLDPVMALGPNQPSRLPPNELSFVRCHGIMFSNKSQDKFGSSTTEFIDTLDNHIARKTGLFIEPSYYMGITTCCSILGYGNPKNPVFQALKFPEPEESKDDSTTEPLIRMIDALNLANKTHDVILRRFGDPNILSYLHVTMVFLREISLYPEAIKHVAPGFPWKLLSLMLNTLLVDYEIFSRVEGEGFPESRKGDRPLPEDWAMRGLLWTERSLPNDLFHSEEADDSERYFEAPSMIEQRKERVLYLGCRIAATSRDFLLYDSTSHRFRAASEFDIEIPGITCEAPPDPEDDGAAEDLEMPDIIKTEPSP